MILRHFPVLVYFQKTNTLVLGPLEEDYKNVKKGSLGLLIRLDLLHASYA